MATTKQTRAAIKVINNLNHNNFFTKEWKDKFPLSSKHFCDFIDAYKKEVHWNKLFNGNVSFESYGGSETFTYKTEAPKFHDIPFEMQYGIIFRWASQHFWHWTMEYPGLSKGRNNEVRWKIFFVELNDLFDSMEKYLTGKRDNEKETN